MALLVHGIYVVLITNFGDFAADRSVPLYVENSSGLDFCEKFNLGPSDFKLFWVVRNNQCPSKPKCAYITSLRQSS
jgi:hypothetical protein